MARRLIRTTELHGWIIYHIPRGQPANTKLVGFIYAPDEQTAIKVAIKEHNVLPNDRGRLVAKRRSSL